MLRPGTRVTKMTQRVGQRAPKGKIVYARNGSYAIKWDDGHISTITPEGIVPLKQPES